MRTTRTEMVESIYSHPELARLVNTIEPIDLRDDLKQELAVILLSMPEEKIIKIWASNELLWFSIKIITNMAFSSTSAFYRKFKKKEYEKAINYLKTNYSFIEIKNKNLFNFEDKQEFPNDQLPHLDFKFADVAQKRLLAMYGEDEGKAHEAILFTKYVELRSCKKVSIFYNIPEKHVKDIIRKTKKELKSLCLQSF